MIARNEVPTVEDLNKTLELYKRKVAEHTKATQSALDAVDKAGRKKRGAKRR